MAHQTTVAERLGKTANLVIFLGLLYSLLHLLHWLAPGLPSTQSYSIASLVLALGIMALGYGIRYGSQVCLYLALGTFIVLSLTMLVLYVSSGKVTILVRYMLSTWAGYRLYRAVPLMRSLRHSDAFPLPMSRYGERVLQRWRHKHR
jgi:hypothetical protein